MRKPKGYVHYFREFLNRPGYESTAFVLASLKRGDGWREVVLRIGDCDRVVSLALEIDDAEERANTVHKLQLLENTIAGLRYAVMAECARLEAKD